MNKVEIVTDDKYEAQKLASLIFVKEGNETFITEIIDVFETEIVISIKDKSCLLYTSPSPRDLSTSRMPSSA